MSATIEYRRGEWRVRIEGFQVFERDRLIKTVEDQLYYAENQFDAAAMAAYYNEPERPTGHLEEWGDPGADPWDAAGGL